MSEKLTKAELCEYVQTNGSFSILIQLYDDSKSVVFLPTASFSNVDEKLIERLKTTLGVDKNLIKYNPKNKRKNTMYKLVLTGYNECAHLLSHLDGCEMRYQMRREVMKLFKRAMLEIKSVGSYHKEWQDEFMTIIELKRGINKVTRTRPGYTSSEWRVKIQEQLSYQKRGVE